MLRQRPAAERARMERLWQLLGAEDTETPPAPGSEEAWADLQRRIADRPARPAGRADRAARPPRRRAFMRRVLPTVTAVAAVLVVGLFYARSPVVWTAPAGEQVRVVLPDASVVELNSGTELRYRRAFGWSWAPAALSARTVALSGEAFFDVRHDGRPFTVETFNARIDVLGTRFAVRSRPEQENGATRVTLVEGRVQVAARTPQSPAVLLEQEGATTRVAAHATHPDSVQIGNSAQATAWQRRGFWADNEPATSILAELERRFALTIRVTPGVILPDSMDLYYARDADAESIIHDMLLTRDAKYRRVQDGFEIFQADDARIP
jgi:ferric-dicitrate binding protein FerR (iron transport regulator)